MRTGACQDLFWSFIFSTIISFILMLLLEEPVWLQSIVEGAVVALHCFFAFLTWILTMSALQYISGSTFSIIYSTTVVFLLIPQYTILSSILPGQRNWMEVMGVVMVLFGSSLASVMELIQTPQ